MLTGAHAIDPAMMRSLSHASEGDGAGYIASARAALERMVANPGLLDAPRLVRKPGGYARNLLFGDAVMSVWAMVWDAGARTSVHDHHCCCCFGMLSGTLSEVRFKTLSDTTALISEQHLRRAGFVDCMLPSRPNLHQMINDGAGEAISIHIYGFDHRLRASSVHREYRIVAQ